MKGFCYITWKEVIKDENEVITSQSWHTRDAWEEYRIAFEKGTYEALFSLPSPKEPYTYDLGSSDGLEVDEESPIVYAARTITLPLILITDTEAEFWSRYNAFRTLLGKSRVLEFLFPRAGYYPDPENPDFTGCRFKLRRTGGGDATILGSIKGTGQKAMRIPITFSDDYPRELPLIPASVFDPEIQFDLIID